MLIKQSQIEPLAKFIVRQVQKNHLATFAKNETELFHLITEVFRKNSEEENKLNDDARKLLDQNKKKLGLNIDEDKAMSMIKKQLAKERNFVL